MVDTFFDGTSFNEDDAVDAMLQNLVANRKELQPVIDALATTIGASITASDNQLSQSCKTCKAAVTRSINRIAQDIATITSKLESTIAINTAELSATIGPLWSAMFAGLQGFGIPDSGTMDLPPGSIVPGTLPPGFIGGIPPMPGSFSPPSTPPFPGSVPGTLPPISYPPAPSTPPYPGYVPGTLPPVSTQSPPTLPPGSMPPGANPPISPPGSPPFPPGGSVPPLPGSPPAAQPPPGYVPPQPIPKGFLPPISPPGSPPLPPGSMPPPGGYLPPLPPIPISVSGSPPYVPPPLPMELPPVPVVPPGSAPSPGTTVIPVPGGGGIVNVFVQPCCPTAPNVNVGGAADERPDDGSSPPKPPNVRVKGAADERPDDVIEGKCGGKTILVPFPTPGSPAWCRAQVELTAMLSNLGNNIIKWIGGVLKDTAKWLDEPTNIEMPNIPIGGGALVEALNAMLTRMKRAAIPALQFMWDYYCSLTRGLKVGNTCDVNTLLGLYAVKAAIELLKQFRFGWDGFAWATLDLAFEIPPLASAVEYICAAACPYRIPEVHEADEAFLAATIDEETYKCWIRAHGTDPDVHYPVLLARRENATTEQIIQYGRRVGWDDETIRKAMRFIGWLNDKEAEVQQFLFNELPTISDHLHWLQRNVFDEEYVKDYGLLDGFDTDAEISKLPGMAGYQTKLKDLKANFWRKFGHDLYAQGMLKEYAANHYAAHWINPSPGQLFEMLRRLRPGRVNKDIEFTEKDLMRLLGEQDVAPYFRERFRAIAYQPFGLRFLRQLYDTRQVDDNELSERLQDISYSKKDADILVKSESIRRARTTATGVRGYTVPTIKALYMAGKITRKIAYERMEKLGYPAEIAADAISAWVAQAQLKHEDAGAKAARSELLRGVREGLVVGVLSQDNAVTVLSQNGYSQDNAKTYVIALVTNDRINLTKKGILQIRKGVLSGRLSLEGARPLLAHLGITADKTQEYINVWQYDLEAGKRVLSQSQIIKAATDGLISLAVARQRLLNLGYDDADALLLTAEAQLAIAGNERKVLDSANKQRQMQAKAVADAIKKNQAQLERFRKQLYALGTPKSIGTWYKDGLVGEAWVRERMGLMGFISGDIDLMILEWDQERAAANAKKAKSASSVGQGGAGSAGG